MESDLGNTADRIAALKDHFVWHERFEPLQERLSLLMEKRLADLSADRITEARGIALSGASGTGKSRAMTHLISGIWKRFAEHDLPHGAIISLRVPSPATLKSVGQMVLRALGYKLSAERQAWYIWDLVRFQLRERKVLFLHLDEAQDLSSRGTRNEMTSVASMLKTLMTDEDWPVGIILSGTTELEEILNHDPQLARRMNTIRFDPISAGANAEDVQGLLAGYAKRGQIRLASDTVGIPLSERLIHAAAFQFGLVIEIIIEAIELAYVRGDEILSQHHFAQTYTDRTACADAFNPFIVDDYYAIDARRVFTRETDRD
ncbi:TniB protein [Yoonia maritima]|uniref:TniB protein n=2 Tax=Yoonia maritima TaxID=1435347 RepID=A0A2T0VTK6_9RHOB|nr:TniB protein [Yoonia maritima]